jgi:hypothetical protein
LSEQTAFSLASRHLRRIVGLGGSAVDNLKIGNRFRVLGPHLACTVAALALATLVGCAPKVTDIVPTRAETSSTLVMATARIGFDRNDSKLGTQREALSRTYEFSNTATFDRQRIVNGRPYTDFDTITRSRESFSR